MSAQSVQSQRLAAFQAALAREEIDLSELRALMSAGLPEGHADTQGMRSICWKLVRHNWRHTTITIHTILTNPTLSHLSAARLPSNNTRRLVRVLARAALQLSLILSRIHGLAIRIFANGSGDGSRLACLARLFV